MRNLFLTVPGLLLALAAGLFAGESSSFCSFSSFSIHSNHTYHVFVIDIDYRDSQADVENLANWRHLGDVADNIPSCGPGQLQACQLIVDECDTELSKDGVRVLKSDVKISALLNKKASVWFVSDYDPAGPHPYEILNEEDDTD